MRQISYLVIFLALILGTASAHAQIKTLHYIGELTEDMRPGDLYVLDNDDTLTTALQTLGTNQWYVWYLNDLQKKGISAKEAFEKTEALWVKIENKTDVRLIEHNTAKVVRELQSHAPVMLETARSTDLNKTTVNQLQSVGINFALNPPTHSKFTVEANPGSLYTNGIFHMGNNGGNKGIDLVAFIKESHIKFSRVVFADDIIKNVKDMDDALTAAGIDHIAYHYTREDRIVRDFNPAIAEAQLKIFEETEGPETEGVLISDRLVECSIKAGALQALK